MKFLPRAALLAAALAAGTAAAATTLHPIAPGTTIAGPLVDLRSPASEGWHAGPVGHAQAPAFAFVRRTPDGTSDVALVSLFPAGESRAPDDFVARVRRLVEADAPAPRYLERESHYEYTEERGYPCVRVRTLADDTQAALAPDRTGTQQLALHALHCRNPKRPHTGFAAGYSRRADRVDAAALAPEAQAFIDGIRPGTAD